MTNPNTALVTSAVAPSVVQAMEVYARIEAVRSVLAPDLNDQELQLFAMVAQRSGLDPFAKQIYAVKRAGRVTFQTGIDGYRSTAERTGEYDGSDEPEFGPMIDQPFSHPEWARVSVYRIRNGRRQPQPATAYWAEFYPGGTQGQMWQKMPRNQLAKCAEALAFRKAFPFVLADLYTDTEMEQAGPAESVPPPAPTARERIAARAAALEPVGVEPEPDPLAVTAPVDGQGEPPAPEVAPVPAGPRLGLSALEFIGLVRERGVLMGAVAKALGCSAPEARKHVDDMTDTERGVLADELNLDWREP